MGNGIILANLRKNLNDPFPHLFALKTTELSHGSRGDKNSCCI